MLKTGGLSRIGGRREGIIVRAYQFAAQPRSHTTCAGRVVACTILDRLDTQGRCCTAHARRRFWHLPKPPCWPSRMGVACWLSQVASGREIGADEEPASRAPCLPAYSNVDSSPISPRRLSREWLRTCEGARFSEGDVSGLVSHPHLSADRSRARRGGHLARRFGHA